MQTTATHCPRSRATAILGLLALALLQVSIAAHQFEHSADHGLNVCHVCTAYSDIENSPHSGTASAGIPASVHAAPGTAIDLPVVTRLVSAYQSRAPPLS
jgi:hypothetical protein